MPHDATPVSTAGATTTVARTTVPRPAAEEPAAPRTGLAGLRESGRSDLVSGFLVFLIAGLDAHQRLSQHPIAARRKPSAALAT